MKISKKNLNKLIENFLFEDENRFNFGTGKEVPSSKGAIGALYFMKNQFQDGTNYLLMDNESLYSLAGGVSNKENINKMSSYMHNILFLICLNVMSQNKISKQDIRRTVIITSLERSPEAQLQAMKNKVKIAKDNGQDPIETVGNLYSPEGDTSMTQAGFENAKKVISLIDQGDDDQALSLLSQTPVSPHASNNAFDFRSEGGRGEKIVNAIENLKQNGVFNQNLNYKVEDEGTRNQHIHVAAISDPITEKGKNILAKLREAKNEAAAEKAFKYMEKVGAI